ncbi:MAG: DNA-binding response regulator [Anaerolineales bacterium]|nr:response regulator transcription factor [Anaerolineae bacterium]PWB51598.1 MAG: DNA-binding response regulator [Anaerolineales bacterium]
MSAMRVVICDDQAIIRDGLELLLKLEKDIEVVGSAQDGTEAVELVAELQPDLVLMDLKMPGMNGVEATRCIVSKSPEVKVLVLTTFEDDEWVFDAIRAGACGYLLKDIPREKLIEAIHGTLHGKSYIDPMVAGKILEKVTDSQVAPHTLITEKLTEREVEVLHLIAHGFSNAEIAEQLHLSEGTIRNHVSAILTKLEVPDRTQAAIMAIHYGIDKLG